MYYSLVTVCKKHSSVATRVTCVDLALRYYDIMRLATWNQVKRGEDSETQAEIQARNAEWEEAVAEALRDLQARGLTLEDTVNPDAPMEEF